MRKKVQVEEIVSSADNENNSISKHEYASSRPMLTKYNKVRILFNCEVPKPINENLDYKKIERDGFDLIFKEILQRGLGF